MLKFDLQKPNDVVAFGRATIDLYANEIGPMEEAKTFSKYVGGSPANTAVAMARLGLKVGYIGKVSDDQFGRFIVRYLADQGVDTSHIETAAPGIRSGVTMGEIKEGSCNCFMVGSKGGSGNGGDSAAFYSVGYHSRPCQPGPAHQSQRAIRQRGKICCQGQGIGVGPTLWSPSSPPAWAPSLPPSSACSAFR